MLLEAERLVEASSLTYRDSIRIEPEDITEDGSFEPAGTVLTVDQALEAMITVSDNGSALALLRLLGAPNINRTLQAAEIIDFRVRETADEDNVATPRGIGRFFSLLATRQLVSPAASERMLARLARQRINDRLPAQLPPGVSVAHKTGNLLRLTHDAGIVFTPFGPRIVVAMTWDARVATTADFIAHVGSAVYAALLDPPSNARYAVPKTALSLDIGSAATVPISVTNAGTKPWSPSGRGAISLIWEMRNVRRDLVAQGPRPIVLDGGDVGTTRDIALALPVPQAPGDYTVTLGLVDDNGLALWRLGAATATFALRVHPPFLANALFQVRTRLHRGEPSLLTVQYAPTPAAAGTPHDLSFAWRAVDLPTGRIVAEGTAPFGTMLPNASGTFFAPFVAPLLRGTYRLEYEVRENGVVAGETASTEVFIGGPTQYPGEQLVEDTVEEITASPVQPRSPGVTPRPTLRPVPTRTPFATPAPTPRPSATPPRATPVRPTPVRPTPRPPLPSPTLRPGQTRPPTPLPIITANNARPTPLPTPRG